MGQEATLRVKIDASGQPAAGPTRLPAAGGGGGGGSGGAGAGGATPPKQPSIMEMVEQVTRSIGGRTGKFLQGGAKAGESIVDAVGYKPGPSPAAPVTGKPAAPAGNPAAPVTGKPATPPATPPMNPAMPPPGAGAGTGATGAAGAAGGMAAMAGPIGAGIAAGMWQNENIVMPIVGGIRDGIKGIVTGAGGLGLAATSFDPNRMRQEMIDFTSRLPIVGTALGGLAGAAQQAGDSLNRYIQGTAAQYNGRLAVQQAMIEVQNLERDIRRSQTMGPQFERFVTAQNNLDVQLQRIMDQVSPVVIGLLTKLLELITAGLSNADEVAKVIGHAIAELAGTIGGFLGGIGGGQTARAAILTVLDALPRLVTNTAPRGEAGPIDPFLDDLLGIARGVGGGFAENAANLNELQQQRRDELRRRQSPFANF